MLCPCCVDNRGFFFIEEATPPKKGGSDDKTHSFVGNDFPSHQDAWRPVYDNPRHDRFRGTRHKWFECKENPTPAAFIRWTWRWAIQSPQKVVMDMKGV
jgi:hypothetical protein